MQNPHIFFGYIPLGIFRDTPHCNPYYFSGYQFSMALDQEAQLAEISL
jgi:hypothetical protein